MLQFKRRTWIPRLKKSRFLCHTKTYLFIAVLYNHVVDFLTRFNFNAQSGNLPTTWSSLALHHTLEFLSIKNKSYKRMMLRRWANDILVVISWCTVTQWGIQCGRGGVFRRCGRSHISHFYNVSQMPSVKFLQASKLNSI